MPNPNRGHADSDREETIYNKRDHRSKKSWSNFQITKKESTEVDTQPGFNYQENKTEFKLLDKKHISNNHIVNKKSLNLIKGEAGDLSHKLSNPKRGQVVENCKTNSNDKRDKQSNYSGFNDQLIKKKFYFCRHKAWV